MSGCKVCPRAAPSTEYVINFNFGASERLLCDVRGAIAALVFRQERARAERPPRGAEAERREPPRELTSESVRVPRPVRARGHIA